MITSKFNTYYDLIDCDYWQNLCVSEGSLCHFEKKEYFVERGCVARYIGYIKSGTLKYVVHSANGEEHVVGLEFAGEFVADFPFSLLGKKSRVSIIAVTPCEIYCVPTKTLSRRLNHDSEFRRIVSDTSIALFDTTYNRYIDLYTKTAQERFSELITRHEDIFTLFSLKDIASFLNITPTHLSRLKKNHFLA